MTKLFNKFGKTIAKFWIIILAYNILSKWAFLLVALFLIVKRLGYKRSIRQAKRTLKQVLRIAGELKERLAE